MCPIGYYTMIRNYKDKKYVRLKMVQHARGHGIKPTARKFGATVKTVRKWLRRWEVDGLMGLEDQSRRPHHCPKAIAEGSKEESQGSQAKEEDVGS